MKSKILVTLLTLTTLAIGLYGVSASEIPVNAEIVEAPLSYESIESCTLSDFSAVEGKASKITPKLYFNDGTTYDGKSRIDGVSFYWEKLNKTTNNYERVSNTFELTIAKTTASHSGTYRFTIDFKNPEWSNIILNIKLKVLKESETTKPNNDDSNVDKNLHNASYSIKDWTDVKLSKKSYNYTGKNIIPDMSIKPFDKNIQGNLVKGKDYTISYKNNKNPGKATIIITGKGKYYGTKKITFKIKISKTSVKSIKVKNNKIQILCKKANNIKGYQIRYKKAVTKKNKTKTGKWKTITSKSTKLKTPKLNKGTYYVQCRTYKKIDGKKYYSSWKSYDLLIRVGLPKNNYKNRFQSKSLKGYCSEEINYYINKKYAWHCSFNDFYSNRGYVSGWCWTIYDSKGNPIISRVCDRHGEVIEKFIN